MKTQIQTIQGDDIREIIGYLSPLLIADRNITGTDDPGTLKHLQQTFQGPYSVLKKKIVRTFRQRGELTESRAVSAELPDPPQFTTGADPGELKRKNALCMNALEARLSKFGIEDEINRLKRSDSSMAGVLYGPVQSIEK